MKPDILNIGISSTLPIRQQTEQFFYDNYTLSSPLSFRWEFMWVRESTIAGISVEIITIAVQKLMNRVMSGDVTVGIASLNDVVQFFRESGKFPMNDGTRFWYFDRRYQERVPVIERTGGDSFDDANKFSYIATWETRITEWWKVPLYDIVFAIDDGTQREGNSPVGVVSRRNMRKIPNLKSVVSDISARAEWACLNSLPYRKRYPRG